MSYVLMGSVPADAVVNYNVRQGSTGDKVMEVQFLLNVFGANLATDGVFGPLTDSAVRGFQRANALTVDGAVGPETSRALQDDDSKNIGTAPSSSLPAKKKASSSTALLVAGGVALVAVAGVAVVAMKKKGGLGGSKGKKRRRNPGRRRRHRVH